MSERTSDKAAILACGFVLLAVATIVVIDTVMGVLAYKAAQYFGYPGFLGVLAVLLVTGLFSALRARK